MENSARGEGEMKTVLHVGCGPQRILGQRGFAPELWKEIRLDIDPGAAPDILGSMTDLSAVESGSVDAVYSSHNIEHLLPHEIPVALGEFLRVLCPEGVLVLTCPDLQAVCALVAQDKLLEPAYHTAQGLPIAPMDILFGWRAAMSQGQIHMAHRSGFTRTSLQQALQQGGFASVATSRGKNDFALYAVAAKTAKNGEDMRALYNRHWGGASGPPQCPLDQGAPPPARVENGLHTIAREERSPRLPLEKLYLQTLKKSLLGEFYVENDARLLYLAWRLHTGQSVDWRVVTNPRAFFPALMQHVECKKNLGEAWYLLPAKRSDGSQGHIDLRNFTDFAYTMIGQARMDNIEYCLDAIRTENIQGDLMETGVCRGGAVIFMKGYLNAWNMHERIIWAADSYEGLPEPNCQQDAGYDLSKNTYPVLAVDLDKVKESFSRYGLLDENVYFLKGWFRDTLPGCAVDKLALLRLDGDLYESTIDALEAMYGKVVPGGFVIVDDYHIFEPCRKAVDEFRQAQGIAAPLISIDPSSVYWRK